METSMSRQLDYEKEQREQLRRVELVKCLEFGLVGALSAQGIDMLGFAMKYDPFNCLMTLKADRNGEGIVSFVGSDTIINCFLKAQSEALRQGLKWREDKYRPHKD